MAASILLYNSFVEYMADGTFDLDDNQLNVTLHTSSYTPDATHTVFANVTNQLSTANGYTSGGQQLSNVTWTRSGGTATLDADNVEWTATGGSITARYAVIRAVGSLNGVTDPLIACVTLDSSDVTATATNKLTIAWAGQGILTVAVAA